MARRGNSFGVSSHGSRELGRLVGAAACDWLAARPARLAATIANRVNTAMRARDFSEYPTTS
jgi:hypothetical protein